MKTPSYRVEPEVAGELGPLTELDTSTHPPAVTRLHYVFFDWLGDDIVESFPCFVVTSELATALSSSGLIGVELDDVETSIDSQFEELADEAVPLPEWRWLRPPISSDGEGLDVWLDEKASLHLSESAYIVVTQFQIENADFIKL